MSTRNSVVRKRVHVLEVLISSPADVEQTTLISPAFCDVATWRDVVKNNARIDEVEFRIRTTEKWLPKVLSDLGFFPSNSEVKRNRSDLWRELSGDTTVKLAWATIEIEFVASE